MHILTEEASKNEAGAAALTAAAVGGKIKLNVNKMLTAIDEGERRKNYLHVKALKKIVVNNKL
jgi:hypothetical protein